MKLRVLRAERQLSLREASARTGVDKVSLSRFERGLVHPQDRTLAKIAKGYGVPVEELLEEPVLSSGKAEAPPSGYSEETVGAGLDVEDRIDTLDSFRESVLAIVDKLGNEFVALPKPTDREDLLTLYSEIAWVRLGISHHLEDEEVMQERTGEPESERRARDRVWRALVSLDNLADDIEEMVDDALEEKPATVAHIADYQRRKRAS